jgi:hypothetical protein
MICDHISQPSEPRPAHRRGTANGSQLSDFTVAETARNLAAATRLLETKILLRKKY